MPPPPLKVPARIFSALQPLALRQLMVPDPIFVNATAPVNVLAKDRLPVPELIVVALPNVTAPVINPPAVLVLLIIAPAPEPVPLSVNPPMVSAPV